MSLEQEFARFGPVAALQGIAKAMCAPLFWHEQSRALGDRVVGGGTCCFVDTGERLIGITAQHVYQGYLEACARFSALECQLGRTLFEPTAQLIDSDARLDLATFSLDPETVRNAGGAAHRPAVDWPPPPPPVSSSVMLGGFPKAFRDESAQSVSHGFASFFTKAENSSLSSISLSLNLEKGIPYPDGIKIVPGTELGGASGGPMLAVQQDPLIAWNLVGVLFQYEATWEIVLARPVANVAPDGSLLRDSADSGNF